MQTENPINFSKAKDIKAELDKIINAMLKDNNMTLSLSTYLRYNQNHLNIACVRLREVCDFIDNKMARGYKLDEYDQLVAKNATDEFYLLVKLINDRIVAIRKSLNKIQEIVYNPDYTALYLEDYNPNELPVDK